MVETYVYSFDDKLIEGASPKALLGGKGAGLAEMTRLGVPVPPGFTVTTAACLAFDNDFPEGLVPQVQAKLKYLEEKMGRRLGDRANPLLVSVRSGAPISMPGMMDTILNLGLNDEAVEGLAESSGDRRFAFDAYRRLLEMYGDVVLGVPRDRFEEAFTEIKRELGSAKMPDYEVPAAALEKVCERSKALILEGTGKPFPQDVMVQLWGAVRAVFLSWNNPRAIRYRRMQEIPDDLGTGVNVQAMVFGNMGATSGSGVCFTRNPSTGGKVLYGEYLPNAQGEDVVAGIRTPRPIAAAAAAPGKESESLERSMPKQYEEIAAMSARLEAHFKDLQDIEFTIERERVYILQTRSGKRSAHAAVKIAVDMVDEGVISREQAVQRVDAESVEQLLHAQVPEPKVLAKRGVFPVATGLPASPGAATGKIVLDADTAEAEATAGTPVVLVRRETSPEDIHGMKAAQGIVTATGGMTSHAAVVARGLGKPCIAGSSGLDVDYEAETVTARPESGDPIVLRPGDVVTLDGTTGSLYVGEVDVEAAAKVPEFDTLMSWADEFRKLRVRANTDTPLGAKAARSYGAEGIGLCRTEHMFFAEDRLEAVRCMVLAENPSARADWLNKIAPMQREDFREMLEASDGYPVTIRLLDWPLHEFLPREEKEYEHVAQALGEDLRALRRRAQGLHEVNPMLGHRGVRLGLTFPEIYRMQTRAICDATVACRKKGIAASPEIMLPVVALGKELSAMVAIVRETIKEVDPDLDIHVGTMIELPRACLVAGELAQVAEFFSFGTNDLTQTTFGVSRDDSGKFLPEYLTQGLLQVDPFARLDVDGVGALIRIAVESGKAARPDLKLGLCGEHGGDPKSIRFAAEVGLSYISCSPPRLPVARLAAAQAALAAQTEG